MRRWRLVVAGLAVLVCCSCGTVVNKHVVENCTGLAGYCEVTAYILDVQDEDTKEITHEDVSRVTYARCSVGDKYPDCSN